MIETSESPLKRRLPFLLSKVKSRWWSGRLSGRPHWVRSPIEKRAQFFYNMGPKRFRLRGDVIESHAEDGRWPPKISTKENNCEKHYAVHWRSRFLDGRLVEGNAISGKASERLNPDCLIGEEANKHQTMS